jgi:hypothetical protein
VDSINISYGIIKACSGSLPGTLIFSRGQNLEKKQGPGVGCDNGQCHVPNSWEINYSPAGGCVCTHLTTDSL